VRVAAISDIHGNLPALEAVLAEIDREGVDEIVVVGDTAHGPWPAEVVDLLVEREALCVRGNADREVIERSDRFGPLAPWSADRIGERRLAIVRDWPLTVGLTVDGLGAVLVCHSTPRQDDAVYTRITPDAELVDILGPVAADVLVSGHTHMQYDRMVGNTRIVNSGSVGAPIGNTGAFWTLLGPEVQLRRTDYDVAKTAESARATHHPNAADQAKNLLTPPSEQEMLEVFGKFEVGKV